MPKLNSLEVVHQDTNKDQFETLHDILVELKQSLALNRELVDGDARVAIENLLEMYVNDKEAFLRSLQTLTAQFKASEAKYEEEILLQASALEALARRTTTLTAQTENNLASVREYSEAVASEVDRKTATYSQDVAPTENLSYGDIWIDTDDNNRMYSWNGIVWVEVSKAPTYRQPTQPADAAEGDLWMDTDNNNKMYRYNGSTWVATDDLRIAKTYARWGVQVNANGNVAGIQLNADDTGTSEFTVLANAFRVYNGSTSVQAFTVTDGQVYISNNLKVSGNIISGGTVAGVNLDAFGNLTTNSTSGYVAITNVRSDSTTAGGQAPISSPIANYGNTTFKVFGSGEVGGNFLVVGTLTPFTGAHFGVVSTSTEFRQGEILVDSSIYDTGDISNTKYYCEKSSVPNQKGVVGVYNEDHFERYEEKDGSITVVNPLTDGNKYVLFNAVGEGKVLVNGENGNISRGDLIVSSSTAGIGMKQDDDIIRSYTVAKAREDVTFSSPTEEKLVPCIYLCG